MADARTAIVDELVHALDASRKRRDFIKVAALGGIGVMVPSFLTACSSDPTNPSLKSSISFGNASGPLNVLYATVQLQNDFYTRVSNSPFIDIGPTEKNMISSVNGQKGSVVSALATVVTAHRISDAVLFNFRSVDFSSRTSVMTVAQNIEEAGVACANWAIAHATTADSALATAKIATAMSRHATVIRHVRDMVATNAATVRPSFGAGVTNGLDKAQDANAWYAATKTYFRTDFSIGGF